MWHDVLTLSIGQLADDAGDSAPGSAVAAIIAAVAGLLTALGGLIASAALLWRRIRGGADDDGEDDADPNGNPPPEPDRPAGRTRPVGQEVEESWVKWTQRQMVRLQEDRAASDQVARSAVAAAERAHEATERAERALETLKADSERRERFLRRGLDPDTGDPLPPRTT